MLPTLKRIADSCPTLLAEWTRAGGEPYMWHGVNDDNEPFARVFTDETGVCELALSQSSIESVPDAVGDLRSLKMLALVFQL